MSKSCHNACTLLMAEHMRSSSTQTAGNSAANTMTLGRRSKSRAILVCICAATAAVVVTSFPATTTTTPRTGSPTPSTVTLLTTRPSALVHRRQKRFIDLLDNLLTRTVTTALSWTANGAWKLTKRGFKCIAPYMFVPKKGDNTTDFWADMCM
jgi:hypothetical protein